MGAIVAVAAEPTMVLVAVVGVLGGAVKISFFKFTRFLFLFVFERYLADRSVGL